MTPQPSVQQLEHAIKNWEARVKAKTLECASLEQMRTAAINVIGKLFNFRDPEKQQPAQDAVHNYLTAKLNQAVLDLQELELYLKAMRQQSSSVIQVPGMQIKR